MDIEFGDHLPAGKSRSEISEERWRRVREDIIHLDLIQDLTGKRPQSGGMIRCPFHGRDSTPSFAIYPPARGNNSHCFGCPPGKQDRDNVQFVVDLLELSPTQALLWIEKHYNLPPLEEPPEDEDSGPEWLVTVQDLLDPFIVRVSRSLRANPDPQEAQEFIRILWDALESENPTEMAQVVGRKRIDELLKRRALYGK